MHRLVHNYEKSELCRRLQLGGRRESLGLSDAHFGDSSASEDLAMSVPGVFVRNSTKWCRLNCSLASSCAERSMG